MALFSLDKTYADEIIAHARAEAPNECCGILAGEGGEVRRLFRASNAEESPLRYQIDPQELYGIYREIDSQGWDILAIYHSHTHSPAYPSATDVELALWPDALYLIASLMDEQRPVLRGFRIIDGAVAEEALVITP